jgi:peptidoglycan hydrolase CwlO-like protein
MIWFILLLSVAILGGIIAYAGDVVGRRVGRKHLRLFGLRPKTTGLVFAVGSGVLVAFLTVGTVALIARDTLENVSRAQEIRSERDQIKRDLESLNTEYTDTQGKLELASQKQTQLEQQLLGSLENLRGKQRELEATADLKGRLNDKAASLERSNVASRAQINTLAGEVLSLEKQRSELRGTVTELARKRGNLEVRGKQLESLRQELEAKIAELGNEKNRLEARATALEKRTQRAEAAIAPTRTRLALLETQVRDATNSKEQVQEDVTSLQADVNELAQRRTQLEQESGKLRQQNLELERSLAERDGDLRQARSALREASRGNFIFREGELILQTVLPDGNAADIRTRLSATLRQASLIAETQGSARGKPLALKPNNDLEPYVAQALKYPGPDLVMVRASRNLSPGLEVPVTLDIRANKTLFLAAQPIRVRELTLGSQTQPKALEDVQSQLARLLRETIADLRAKGVPSENIPFESLNENSLIAFAQKLEPLSGTVTISVASRKDVTPSGPLEFYFEILTNPNLR